MLHRLSMHGVTRTTQSCTQLVQHYALQSLIHISVQTTDALLLDELPDKGYLALHKQIWAHTYNSCENAIKSHSNQHKLYTGIK